MIMGKVVVVQMHTLLTLMFMLTRILATMALMLTATVAMMRMMWRIAAFDLYVVYIGDVGESDVHFCDRDDIDGVYHHDGGL